VFDFNLLQFLIWPAGVFKIFASFGVPPVSDPHHELEDMIKQLSLDVRNSERYSKIHYYESGFPTAEALNAISTTGEQKTTEKTVAIRLPSGALLKRASVISSISALNNSANAQKIDVAIEARKGAGSFATYYSQDDVFGFGAVDGATSSILAISNITALVDDLTATYGFRCSINQSSANSVRYTTQHVLIISYALS
jgi:hypothetical protein